MRRRYAWPFLGLVAVLCVVAAGIVFVTATPAGTALLVDAVARFVPELELRAWRGTLLSELCVEEFAYRREGVIVTGADVCVVANVFQSLDASRISLQSVDAAEISVATTGTANDPQDTFEPVRLPLAIEVESGSVGLFTLDALELSTLDVGLFLRNTGWRINAGFRVRLPAAAGIDDFGVSVRTRGPLARLGIEAELALPEVVRAQLQVNADRADLPYQGSMTSDGLDLSRWLGRDVRLRATSLAATGDLKDGYRYQLQTTVADPVVTAVGVRAQGSGDLTGMSVSLTAEAESGLFSLAGRLGWQPSFEYDLEIAGESFTFHAANRTVVLAGRLQARGGADLVSVRTDGLRGSLDGVPFGLSADAVWRPDLLAVDQLELDLGRGSFRVTGTAGGRFDAIADSGIAAIDAIDASVSLHAFPLAPLDQRLSGTIDGSFTARGSPARPQLDGTLTADDLSLLGARLVRVEAEVHASEVVRAAVRAAGVEYDGMPLGEGNIELQGDQNGGRASVAWRRNGLAGTASGNYSREGDVVRATIDVFDLQSSEPEVGVTLTRPTRLTVSGPTVQTELVCVTLRAPTLAPGNEICATGSVPDGPLVLRPTTLTFVGVPLPRQSGTADAVVGLAADVSRVRPLAGQARLDLTQLSVSLPELGMHSLGELHVVASVADGQGAVSVASPAEQLVRVNGQLTGRVPEGTADGAAAWGNADLTGDLSVFVGAIRLFESLLPPALTLDVADLDGKLELGLQVVGTVAEPDVTGRFVVSDARWFVVPLGAGFRDVNLRASARPDGTLSMSGTGRVGEGQVNVGGRVERLLDQDWTVTARADLSGARLLDLPDYGATVEGAVDVTLDAESLVTHGALTLPEASIRISQLPETAQSVSSDVVVVGRETTGFTQARRTTDITLVLGESVHLKAFGLDARLRGSLRLLEKPEALPYAEGTIELEQGTFKAYGQTLSIDRGRLVFAGPLDDPVVDVVASRRVKIDGNDVVVSLVLSGTAQSMNSTVRSDPAMTETDALAVLITGRRLSSMTSQERSDVSTAALAFGLSSAARLTTPFVSRIGVEDVIVENNEGSLEVGAGVRLQPNVYLRYTYGVFSRVGGVLLRYELSDRVSVHAQAGDAQSIEIRYGVQ